MKILECFKNFFAIMFGSKAVALDTAAWSAAIEHSEDSFFLTDENGYIKSCNRACLALYGAKTNRDFIGQSWTALFNPADTAELSDFIDSTTKNQGHWSGYFMAMPQNKTSESFPLEVSVSKIKNGRHIWVCRNYSESLEYISKANKRLSAMNAASDGIAIIDANGNFSYLNKAMLALHAIPSTEENEFIGKPWMSLYADNLQTAFKDGVIPVLEQLNYWKGDTPIESFFGDEIHVEMSLTLLPDGSMIGTAHDNSKRKTVEVEKEQIQMQFFQAQKMESLGRLAGGIAHDFNNILAAVKGYAEFLVDDLKGGTESAFHAQQIMQGTVQAQGIIEQILAFSRSGDVEVSNMNLVECIEDTLAIIKPTIPPFVSVKDDISLEAAYVLGNKTQISQAIMNLCINGLHALDKGKDSYLNIRIEAIQGDQISFKEQSCLDSLDSYKEQPPLYVFEDGANEKVSMLQYGFIVPEQDYIEICIEDNGCGISRAILEKIFDPFFTTKEKDHGTGLGLSTVHGVVAGFKGALDVKTEIGKGSAFKMYFPSEYVQGQTSSKPAIVKNMAGAGHIVLIDDEDKVRAMMKNMLSRMGYNVEAFSSAQEALKYICNAGASVDLVVSDYTMPKMTGADFAQALYKNKPDLPIIIVSGFAKEKLMDISHKNPNVKAVVAKPINRSLLYQTIQDTLYCEEDDKQEKNVS